MHGWMLALAMAAGVIFPGSTANAQGLVLNELSNGPSGAKEYFEFIVVGSAGAPTGPVNLDGWIVDDNNGEWGGSSTGVGIAPGYVRINATGAGCGALAAVSPGSLVVVYNSSDLHPGIAGEDIDDANGDGVFFLDAEGACVTTWTGAPSASNPGYTPSAPGAPNYGVLALRNQGDAGQSRRPDGSLFHGFSYGDVPLTPTPVGSFKVSALTGTNAAYIFACGSWNVQANFSRILSAGDTPGQINNVQNAIFRARVQAGTFNYDDLSDPANCVAVAATNDSVSGINGQSGAADVLNVFGGDTINGAPATAATATLSVAAGSSVPAQLNFDTSTGNISVVAGSLAGTYSFVYRICDQSNPLNCTQATASVTIAPSVDLAISKTNTPGVNGEVDQTDDAVVTGTTTNYTIVVTNNGPDAITGAVVTDSVGSGLTCPAGNPVTLSGDGVPAGSFTVGDLTGPGITLGTLTVGQSTTLTLSCQVN